MLVSAAWCCWKAVLSVFFCKWCSEETGGDPQKDFLKIALKRAVLWLFDISCKQGTVERESCGDWLVSCVVCWLVVEAQIPCWPFEKGTDASLQACMARRQLFLGPLAAMFYIGCFFCGLSEGQFCAITYRKFFLNINDGISHCTSKRSF